MKEVTINLEATKSYAIRSARWKRYTRSGYRCCGVLTIIEQKKAHAHPYTTRYAVLELTEVQDGRRFGLHKPNGTYEGEDGEYFVLLARRRGMSDQCTCKGWSSGGTCKHVTTLRALSNHRGLLPPWKAVKKKKAA